MSVISLSNRHISALANATFRLPISYYYNNKQHLLRDDPERIATILLTENLTSYNTRYRKPPPGSVTAILYPYDPSLSQLDIIKLTHSYIYQTNESPTWRTSEARAIAEAIINFAIFDLPGYDDAPWII